MLCPHCKSTLTVTHRQEVEIDMCPQCRGVWLDRGELDKIIDRYDRYVADDRGDYEHRRHAEHPKRKSFWQEIFD